LEQIAVESTPLCLRFEQGKRYFREQRVLFCWFIVLIQLVNQLGVFNDVGRGTG